MGFGGVKLESPGKEQAKAKKGPETPTSVSQLALPENGTWQVLQHDSSKSCKSNSSNSRTTCDLGYMLCMMEY